MEATPKVHRHRHRRSSSRRNNQETLNSTSTERVENETYSIENVEIADTNNRIDEPPMQLNERNPPLIQPSVLVNGQEPHIEDDDNTIDNVSGSILNGTGTGTMTGGGTSHESSSSRAKVDSISLGGITPRRPLPNSPRLESQHQLSRGILGFMDRELKIVKKCQSLSDPTASPAQRSTRSRSSLEKSPRRKRSKSESRRRRERKLIAAGEMEVRQANETLMRYLKQCTEMNDASLSGELEIDHNFDERRVLRKTKSQRDKRGHLISKTSGKLYTAGGLTSILRDLSEDIVPADGEEIYNPFTPVVSPTDEAPTRIDKMFIQTSSGYRPVDRCYYKHPMEADPESNRQEINTSVNLACALQRIWIMISNICHGLLAGLALAHLLFIATTRPSDWAVGAIQHYSSFAEIYANTFYCLTIVCIISVFDRMDILHINLNNASELISFRWIIIAMIYISTIILTLCAESMDEQLYLSYSNVTILQEQMENNQVLNVWNSLSMARSIGAVSGWIMIGFSPGEDLLYVHLLEMEKYQLTNN